MIKVEIQMFGALKKFSEDGVVELELKEPMNLGEVRTALITKLNNQFHDESIKTLINTSAFGNENEVLEDDAIIKASAQLALLPPVCGG